MDSSSINNNNNNNGEKLKRELEGDEDNNITKKNKTQTEDEILDSTQIDGDGSTSIPQKKDKGKEPETSTTTTTASSTTTTTHSTTIANNVIDLVTFLFSERASKRFLSLVDLDDNIVHDINDEKLKEGLEILEKIKALISDGKSDKREILPLSYSFLQIFPPHNKTIFSNNVIPSTLSLIEDKQLTLETLKHVVYVMETSKKNKGDANLLYQTLSSKFHTTITPLATTSIEYKNILKYVGNTNFPKTHFQVIDFFSVDQDLLGKFPPPFFPTNRTLLFMGVPIPNLTYILTHGLSIPNLVPPSSPCGNALYFTDLISQAIPDCKCEQGDIVCVLLCDVALGTPHHLFLQAPTGTITNSTVPTGKQSIKCVGKMCPNVSETTNMGDNADTYLVPFGKAINVALTTDFQYNKYAVFDPNQVKIRFILRLDLYKDGSGSSSSSTTTTGINNNNNNNNNNNTPINFVNNNLPMGKGKWFYSDSKGGWKPYDDDKNKEIDEKFRGGALAFRLNISGTSYSVDFRQMVQYQTFDHQKARRIKRENA